MFSILNEVIHKVEVDRFEERVLLWFTRDIMRHTGYSWGLIWFNLEKRDRGYENLKAHVLYFVKMYFLCFDRPEKSLIWCIDGDGELGGLFWQLNLMANFFRVGILSRKLRSQG
jgi:hypothetical protein